MSRSLTKAAHYVLLLDESRCESNWDVVPEYVRKVRKHATGRNCLTLTAETEFVIDKATRNLPPPRRPGDAAPVVKSLDVATQLPKLLAVISEESAYLQDRYQARVCVGWLHWVVGDYDNALVALPDSLDVELDSLDGRPEPSQITNWTKVCALKAAYLRANCLERKTRNKEALIAFEAGLPYITSYHATKETQKQQQYWSELFLTEYCILLSHTLEQGETSLEDSNCLVSLRAWAKYWEGTNGTAQLGGHGFRISIPRRRIWFEYYSVLSSLLKDDLPFPSGHAPTGAVGDLSARNQLRVELKRVEGIYETVLLEETSFPRAEEEREEVENFIRLVMQNWTVLKDPSWRESDLGQGGKESISRGVIDILYRASAKTYHSTAIMRDLFTVHLAVAEFDLAFKAFDSYLNLVKKGKARVIKTGKDEPNLDKDAVVLETICLCIVSLCRYGDRQAVQKAHDLSQELEQCLHELWPAIPEENEENLMQQKTTLIAKTKGAEISLRIIAASWQAVGLALAQWSRMTYDSASRPEIQTKAIRYLRKSLSPEFGRSANLRSVFALGLLLAEQRELGAAIELVKGVLLSSKAPDPDHDFLSGPHCRERAMLPLWHLLSLLLSARQDYFMAAQACEGAFEQFKDRAVLFGSEHIYRSEHLNEAEANSEKHANWSRGLVDDMEDFEKETILEVKMTQLALVELLESPKVAVNASLELLSLFARLFGPSRPPEASGLLPVRTEDVPKSSAGTLRSIKGSIFGRSGDRTGRPTTRQSGMAGSGKPNLATSRPQTTQTTGTRDAPAIQVTRDRDDIRRDQTAGSFRQRRSQSGKRNSLRKRDGSGSQRRAVSSGGSPAGGSAMAESGSFFALFDERQHANELFPGRQRHSSTGPPVSLNRQASQVDAIASRAEVRAIEAENPALEGVETTLSAIPVVQFSKEHEKRRHHTILAEVWLMIAGFYRHATMFDDAKRAVAEAQKLVQDLELDLAKNAASGVSANTRVWVGKKSIDELWADVWAEMGYLSLNKGNAYSARLDFEAALTHFPDHPAATIGLSNILLDTYSEKIFLPHAIPRLELADGTMFPAKQSPKQSDKEVRPVLPSEPLGLATGMVETKKRTAETPGSSPTSSADADALPPPYKASSLPKIDRIAARDRAFGLLSGLTKLGSSWNNSAAWFVLARAYEESGEPDKAKEALWWCVELEETTGVRPWSSVAYGGYIL